MYHFYADDGRILTSPKDLEPLLKGAFSAFSKLLGHIRFFYIADEIWDGKFSLVFNAAGQQLASVILDDAAFHVHISDKHFQMTDETFLDTVYETLKTSIVSVHQRPFEQLTASSNPNIFPCGYRCDLCLGYRSYNEPDASKCDDFVYLNWLCYHDCVPNVKVERLPTNEKSIFRCSGCNKSRNKFCRSYNCSQEKGFANCTECGAYHSCDIYKDSHYAAQCNLGITAEEITKLVIPYCMKERLDIMRSLVK